MALARSGTFLAFSTQLQARVEGDVRTAPNLYGNHPTSYRRRQLEAIADFHGKDDTSIT
jgi:hypothetical protein